MGILDKIFGRYDRPTQPEDESVPTEESCPHTALVPHWDNPADMGVKERAEYRCESCGQTFSYEDALQFLEQPPAVLAGVTPDSEREDRNDF
jgi:hypothetical protein